MRARQALKDTQIANPARNVRMKKVLKTMARKLGRGRRHSPVMMQASVSEVQHGTVRYSTRGGHSIEHSCDVAGGVRACDVGAHGLG